MIVARFKSVGWVAGIATMALCCYLVSQSVASERGRLDAVDRNIADVQSDIRRLQTELATRSRLAQLERWNNDIHALSSPKAGQFLENNVALMQFEKTAPAATSSRDMKPAAFHVRASHQGQRVTASDVVKTSDGVEIRLDNQIAYNDLSDIQARAVANVRHISLMMPVR